METQQDFTGFLPLIDSSNGLLKLTFVEAAIFEIMGGGGGGSAQPPFIEGVGIKYLRTGKVNINGQDNCFNANRPTLNC